MKSLKAATVALLLLACKPLWAFEISIFVETSPGSRIPLQLSSQTRGFELETRVGEQTGLYLDDFSLVFEGHLLSQNSTLNSVGIQTGSIVYMNYIGSTDEDTTDAEEVPSSQDDSSQDDSSQDDSSQDDSSQDDSSQDDSSQDDNSQDESSEAGEVEIFTDVEEFAPELSTQEVEQLFGELGLNGPHESQGDVDQQRSATRRYTGSEAEIFKAAFESRVNSVDYIHSVRFEDGEIETAYVDPLFDRTFKIVSPALARRLGVQVNTVFNQEQIQMLSDIQQEIILDPINFTHGAILQEEGQDSPAYEQRPVESHESDYIATLREVLNLEFSEQNGVSPNGWFQYEAGIDGIALYDSAIQTQLFQNILETIKNNDETLFLNALFDFGALFPIELAEHRRAALDTFTYLFVTKQFPSIGMRSRYLHFILRCGQLY